MTEFGDRLLFASGQGLLALCLVSAVTLLAPKLSPTAKAWLWRLAFLRFLLALGVELPVPVLASSPVASSTEVVSTVVYTRSAPAVAEPVPIWLLAWAIPAVALFVAGVSRFAKIAFIAARAERVSSHIRASSQVQVPCLIGLWRGLILLPSALLHPARAEECALAIAHETAHRDRRDPLFGLVNFITVCVFWFVLPVWFALREYAVQVEMDCDQRALRSTHLSPRQYGGMLVALATQKSLPVGALSMAGSPSGLKRRLTAMKNPIHKSSFASLAFVGLLGACLLVPVRPVEAMRPTVTDTPLQRKVDEIIATVPKSSTKALAKLKQLRSDLGKAAATKPGQTTFVWTVSPITKKGKYVVASPGQAYEISTRAPVRRVKATSSKANVTISGKAVAAGEIYEVVAPAQAGAPAELTVTATAAPRAVAGVKIVDQAIVGTSPARAVEGVQIAEVAAVAGTAPASASVGIGSGASASAPAQIAAQGVELTEVKAADVAVVRAGVAAEAPAVAYTFTTTADAAPARATRVTAEKSGKVYIVNGNRKRVITIPAGQNKVTVDGITIIVSPKKGKKGETTITVTGGR